VVGGNCLDVITQKQTGKSKKKVRGRCILWAFQSLKNIFVEFFLSNTAVQGEGRVIERRKEIGELGSR